MNISVNHLGFMCRSEKRAVISGNNLFDEFLVINLNEMGYNEIGPNTKPNSVIYKGKLVKKQYCWGDYYIADFSVLDTPGIFLISLGNKYNSVPFQIRDDVYGRTLRKPFDYIHAQRCGGHVPFYHGACHLDDARFRDTKEHCDTVGGWHDAGDLRKWTAHTMMLGIGLNQLRRIVNPSWRVFDPREGDILNELKWGNQYFLKAQSESGLVWHDVAGGVDGDNSDNHWTANVIGDTDDRYINTTHNGVVQWEFIYFEAMNARSFADVDPHYALICKDAALRTYEYAAAHEGSTCDEIAWSVLAVKELYRATGDDALRKKLDEQILKLLLLQEKEFKFNQSTVRGFFYADAGRKDFFRNPRDSGVPLIALCEAYDTAGSAALRNEIGHAIGMYCDEYCLPLMATSPFGIMPYGIYAKTVDGETYRKLEGDLAFRFFVEVKGKCAFGLNSHLLSHAVGFCLASRIIGKKELNTSAKNQLEWVMGFNPINACMMTGEGVNNPYPHSRFLGLIIGGVMNGIAGNEDDMPFIDMHHTMDWRTTEYWSPHVAYYIWTACLLHGETGVDALPY
jgi:hypothetical protein